MFLEFDTLVKREQFRDYQREADRAQLARAGRPAARVGLGLLSWIRRLAGVERLGQSHPRPVYRAEETTAL